MPPEAGLPGRVAARNITPDKETGIGNWTDGEKIRAIREGIGRDGHALFPMMPYESFRHMSDEDVYSLVAYLNSLPPVKCAACDRDPVSGFAPDQERSAASRQRAGTGPLGQAEVRRVSGDDGRMCHLPYSGRQRPAEKGYEAGGRRRRFASPARW